MVMVMVVLVVVVRAMVMLMVVTVMTVVVVVVAVKPTQRGLLHRRHSTLRQLGQQSSGGGSDLRHRPVNGVPGDG